MGGAQVNRCHQDHRSRRVSRPSSEPVKAGTTNLGRSAGRTTEGVVDGQLASDFTSNEFSGDYFFSLRNQQRESMMHVHCLVVFIGSKGRPSDFDVIRCEGGISAGLAKTVTSGVSPSVAGLTKWNSSAAEFRIHDCEILDYRRSLPMSCPYRHRQANPRCYFFKRRLSR
jgi:hypothetical protein